jgi:16S rRNA G966 N2-methylase RsmD
VLVENARPALACLRENVVMLGAGEDATVLPYGVERALEMFAKRGESFDIIFLDPPFANVAAYTDVMHKVAAGHLLAAGGILIAQHDARVALPEQVGNLTRTRLRPIGDNALAFYQYAAT